MASTSEVSSATTIVSARARKNTPGDPVQKGQRDENHDRRQRRADQRPKEFADARLDSSRRGRPAMILA